MDHTFHYRRPLVHDNPTSTAGLSNVSLPSPSPRESDRGQKKDTSLLVDGFRLPRAQVPHERVVQAEDVRQGALVGLYRYLTENVKLGAGYNFTDFSDDLTDQSYRSRGWFLNAVATF
jgi:hypothetical protein